MLMPVAKQSARLCSHGRCVRRTKTHLRGCNKETHLRRSARCKAQWPLCQLSKHRPRSRQMTNGAGFAGSKKATGADWIGLLVGPLKIGLRAGPIQAAVAVRAAAAANKCRLRKRDDDVDDSPCHWAPSISPGRTRDGRGHGRGLELPGDRWIDVHAEISGSHLNRRIQRRNNIDWKRHFAMSWNRPPLLNLVISNVVIGEDCQMDELAQWCHESRERIIVASMLPSAMKASDFILEFVKRATIASLHDLMLQHSGATPNARPHWWVSADNVDAAVAVATKDKFIFSLWDGGGGRGRGSMT